MKISKAIMVILKHIFMRYYLVNRFVVKRSMEERIYSMMKAHQHEECDQGSHCTEENILTVHDLQSLFVEQNKRDVQGNGE